ncbi:MAG: MmgE/PrpD family protein [Acidobacteria bacterium]|nr:MmgE/PrpD family protein [Acidobacteriota bacterium]
MAQAAQAAQAAQTGQAAPALAAPALTGSDLTGRLARYMAAAPGRDVPAQAIDDAKARILDTLAAIVSGSSLPPGQLAMAYVRDQGGTPQASVACTDIRSTAVNAAFAGGMLAHADETDDFEPVTKAHPGCSVVPAALAVGEWQGRSGREFIRAVVLGYDLCCRVLMALGPDHVRATHRSAEGLSSTFGAAAAAAAMARFDERQMRFAISYAAQQMSGLWSWRRDEDHTEKAFDFSGMGARNGVAGATMVMAGFTGVDDVLDGTRSLVQALSTEPRPEELVADLGSRFYVSETAIKVFSVGYPIQSPLDAFLGLYREHALTPASVSRIVVRMPPDGAGIVDNSPMPDVNCQHLIAVALVDGTVSFDASHSRERMLDPAVRAVRERVTLIGDPQLNDPSAPRSGLVQVTLADGRTVERFTRHAPGTRENPLSYAQVADKARGLIAPVLGEARAEAIVERVNTLDALGNVGELAALMSVRV